ncbi:hypothetical protein ERO13_A02G085300v2 [Gossypium hirsutum]|uniref:Uncharacterized protein n=4 Tax=Gossypium TaxID=3633 RepID=A0A5J5WNY0_GOSBA|nr:hypothetical protein ES319_A02G098100v1 [Gossypium barbadense]KAG4211217.1 hypothetical protein ERO13_A02G085300v2 [Gossypium hirsutum]TYH27946.1 hypothetical protein ES288_A02G107900v1 [Gossypium darwinii]TYI39673.1 hypothetical protein ES332_A02G110700v1 [Gossypium tomentosum]TYJ46153.1 hypothetical protein E1A91_A02G101300v1 [Gossypium mustelinum]
MGWLKRAIAHKAHDTYFVEMKWICWFLLIALFAFHEDEVGDLQARPFTDLYIINMEDDKSLSSFDI